MVPNAVELRKFGFLSFCWLTFIFGAVWFVCWLVGILVPRLLGLFWDNECSRFISSLCEALIPILAVMVFIPINAMFMVLAERRALALFTMRKGPNRVGPDGGLQTLADALKLLLKEDITPVGADAFMFTLAPIIFFAPSIFAAIPLLAAVTNNHELFRVANLPTGIFYVLAASSVPVVGLVMGGWASNNKYSLIGALRSAAQAISYEIPLVLSIITICYLAGTLDVVKIAAAQSGGILNWNLFGGGALVGVSRYLEALKTGVGDTGVILNTFYPSWISWLAVLVLVISTIFLFGIYLTGACAEINRIPFDLPEAESELVSGYNTEYSGIKFAIFFLAEFTNLFVVATVATVMFLGAGDCPLPDWLNPFMWPPITQAAHNFFHPLVGVAEFVEPKLFFAALWVIFKVYALVFFAILVRGTLPRFRIDQLMAFGWKRLIPLTLIILVCVTFAKGAMHIHV
jgi:NADH-quinone oxidoreductase subunit H